MRRRTAWRACENVEDHEAVLSGLQESVEALKGDVGDIKKAVVGLRQDVKSLRLAQAGQSRVMAQMATDVSTARGGVAELHRLRTDLATIEVRLNILEEAGGE